MTGTQQLPPFKTVYLYDQNTSEYLGPYQAQLDPVENSDEYLLKNSPKYITPVHHTEVAPPEPSIIGTFGANKVQVFLNDTWELKSDYRGQTIYNQKDGSSAEVAIIGEILAGYSLTPPPPTPEQINAMAQATVSPLDSLIAALIDKGVITQKDLDVQTALLMTAQIVVITALNKKSKGN